MTTSRGRLVDPEMQTSGTSTILRDSRISLGSKAEISCRHGAALTPRQRHDRRRVHDYKNVHELLPLESLSLGR